MTDSPALVTILSTSFVVGLSGAAAPGPLLAYTVARTMRQGVWVGPLISVGHSVIEFAIVMALAVGLGALLQRPTVGGAVGVVGGAFLLWMGYSMLRMRASETVTATPEAGAAPIFAAAAVTLSNPFWFVWWVTIGSTFLAWSLSKGTAGLATFYTGHIFADFAWYTLVALLVSRGRSLLAQRWYWGLLRVCGIFLLALGVWFVVWGVQRLT